MKTNLLAFLLLLLLPDTPQGYRLSGEEIVFVYDNQDPGLEVVVSGNFNRWGKEVAVWKMRFDPVTKRYLLNKAIDQVRQQGRSFYEFTFKVNRKLIDADPKASNVIHCAGYGYRYVIRFE